MTNYNYHQLLKYVYFEGYADSYEEAESLLEELTDEEFSQLYSLYESSGMSPGNRETWNRLVREKGPNPFTNPRKSTTKSASRREEPTPQQSSPKPKKRRLDYEVREDYEMILSYLLDEGYADNEDSAVAIMNSMSEEWIESIVEGYVPWDASRYVWKGLQQVLTGRPSPRDVAAARQSQQTGARAQQIARVRANMRQGVNATIGKMGENIPPSRLGTMPLTPRHVSAAQRTGTTAGNKTYIDKFNNPSIPIPSSPELKRQNTSAQLRQALRTGGSSSLPNLGRGVQQRPSGTGRFTPGTGGNFGISGIGLAN